MIFQKRFVALLSIALIGLGCSKEKPNAPADAATGAKSANDTLAKRHDLEKLRHIVVIYLENHSFDNLYGEFPGANGISNAGDHARQVDRSGKPYRVLPRPPGKAFPANLPNAPFSIEQYVPINARTPDLVHCFYQEQAQIDGGRMDRFPAISDAQGLVMGYYHTGDLPLADEAAKNTLCDNFFHGAFGGSFLNHIFFVALEAPRFANAPASMKAQVDAKGNMIRDGAVTPDGFAVNTVFTVNAPHPANAAHSSLMPNQTMPTIGDRLSAKNVSWAWYSGGWNDAIAGHPAKLFQFHHQPFAYFANYADGTPGRAQHLKDETEFIAAARAGKLPAVAFVKPLGEVNEHPGYANVLSGEQHVVELLRAMRASPEWQSTAVIITYDENGGFWDHVSPPKVDRWGPGSRIPTIVISPYAKHGYIDHTVYDTSSILALIEHRFGLEPLGTRDARANDMSGAFDFSQSTTTAAH
ncbi:MAG TPA: acid phosphatase [Gemmatimonadaceae bacterium]|nr:acid phosphatase [Gemmatimonadaceae bacterium]